MSEKKTISISIDNEIHNKAKQMGYNISGECEHALRVRTQATKKDAPENSLKLFCDLCNKQVEFGFLCRERNMFVCEVCHKDWNCRVQNEHEHIRLPAFDKDEANLHTHNQTKQNYQEIVDIRDVDLDRVAVNGSKEQ